MSVSETIHNAYLKAKSYPELVQLLIDAGVKSYTVEVSSGIILYRLDNGENILHSNEIPVRAIAVVFDQAKTIEAIRDNQQGKSDYPGFMQAIAAAGVRFYEATLSGSNKRVTYIGVGGHYEESIPL